MLTIHGHRCVVLQKYFYRVIINEIIAINTRFYLFAQIIAGEIIFIQETNSPQ